MSFQLRQRSVIIAAISASALSCAGNGLLPPVNLKAINAGDGGFTATWDAVDGADAYIARLYETTCASSAAQVCLLDEDFSLAQAGTPDNVSYAGNIDGITHASGWETSAFAQSDGNFVFVPSVYPVELTTCEINVPAGSRIDVSLTLAEYYNERYFTGGELEVSLIEADGSAAVTKTVVISRAGSAAYAVSFDTGGRMRECRFRMCYGNGGNRHKLFLSNVSISQYVEAGSDINILSDEVVARECEAGFSITPGDGARHSFAVACMRHSDADPSKFDVVSVFSAPCDVDADASVADAWTDDDAMASVWVSGPNEITAMGRCVRVFTLDGRCIYNGGGGVIAVGARAGVAVVDGKTVKFSF